MTLRSFVVMTGVGVLLLTGCKRQASETAVATEQTADLVSALDMGDLQAATQLTHGFHAIESGNWRWVASKFGVTLSPPDGTARGAQLELKFSLPASVFDKLGAVTLSATVAGKALPPETLSSAGEHTYTRELAAGTFGPGPVTIEFSTDKALPPAGADVRELALIVTHVGLNAK